MPKKRGNHSIVYSTNPDFFPENQESEGAAAIDKKDMLPVVSLDNKHRSGKTVTLIKGLRMKDVDLEEVTKALKVFCGTGGSCKDGQVIIQGDHREKVFSWLKKNGYSGSKLR